MDRWLYPTLAWILLSAAGILLIWALLCDRRRRMRRCPRCWYDMSGTPGLRCSECGREVRSERRLHRTRRRWRWTIPAAILLLLSYLTHNLPRFQARGWVALVPSTYLVYFAPVQAAPQTGNTAWSSVLSWPTTPPTPATPAKSNPLADETWKRLLGSKLARWQSQAYLRRVMRFEKIDPGKIIRIPKVWPLGAEIPCAPAPSLIAGLSVAIGPPGVRAWGPHYPREFWLLPALYEPASSVETAVYLTNSGGRIVYTSRHTLPIEASLSADAFMSRIDTPETTADVQAMLSPHLALSEHGLELILYNRPDREARKRLPFIVAYVCEVRLDGRVLATKTDDAPWKPDTWVVWSASRIEWPEDALNDLKAGKACITIRGDPVAATRVYTRTPFDPPDRVCWAGRFEAQLHLKPHPRTP